MDREAVSIKKELEKEGYSREERYFYQVNRQLIERNKKNRVQAASPALLAAKSTSSPEGSGKLKSFFRKVIQFLKPKEEVPKLF